MLRLGILTVMLLLVGCEEHYRYPCQDPDNWQNEECQKPKCEVDGQCSSELTGGHSEDSYKNVNQEVKNDEVKNEVTNESVADEIKDNELVESTNE